MELEIVHNEEDSRFEVLIEEYNCYVEYIRTSNNLLSITSTQVPEQVGGRGIAGQLTKYALDYARAEGLKVNPICPYTAAYIKKNTEYEDLLRDRK